MAWVVENPALDSNGLHRGTFRIYVATEERARALATAPGATYRPVEEEQMPEAARENMRRAAG
jgi:hypothetical protein